MSEAQLINLIRSVIRQELAPTTLALLQSNQSQTRSTVQRNQSEGPISNLRNVQPYGVSSRAPAGTQVLTTPVSFDASHVLLTGCFDEAKPAGLDGETLLYDAFGHVIYLSQSKVQLGSETAAENVVLGQVFQAFQAQLLELLANHTHPGIGAPPTEQTQFEQLKSSPINDGKILSQVVFTE